ncbi:hypothetical protein QU481_03525 [Crenobacter sp. SG2303]|uniref:Uncharacterized protein n=1 Tax=Crenobacter oryzisoli TaxID=3056844 RepID=A0ABT7XJL4_9NEIS|nr:hypothetical protein [Crenobacter sp. SG2303]MDN0073963.1 hypothetical protein [Crenobacter sp. SG2303]
MSSHATFSPVLCAAGIVMFDIVLASSIKMLGQSGLLDQTLR